MKRSVLVTMAILVVVAMLLGSLGCATEPPPSTAMPAAPTTAPMPVAEATTEPAPATEPTTAAQPVADVIELKLHHHMPPPSCLANELFIKWAENVAEKTNGRIKVTIYPGETLGKSQSAVDMAINGIADMSWGNMGNFPGRFPLTEVASLPMLGVQSGRHGSQVVQELYETTPEIQEEWSEVHVLFLHTQPPHELGLVDKKVETLEDLKGVRARSLAGPPLKYFQALGLTPVTVPMPETFEALQKGTIDAYSSDWNGTFAFGWYEVCKYQVDLPLFPQVFFFVMNKKKWDSLPPDLQQALNEVSGQTGSEMFGGNWDNPCESTAKEECIKNGMEALPLSEPEKARWTEAAAPVWDEWVATADSKGVDGRALLEKTQQLVEKYK